MPKLRGFAAACLSLLAALAAPARAETVLRMGWCAPVVSPAAAPYAVAQKLGWFAEAGFRLQLVPLPGSTDCVKQVATGELPYSFPSIEPLAIIRPQGVKARNFYTLYQGNIYGIAVLAESPVQRMQDLKGKIIGVTTMGSAGVIVARALAADAGLNPDTDIRIVAAGEAGQAAAMVRGKQVDALSQFITAYALVENAGVKLRYLDNSMIARFPSNGLIALESTLATRRAEAVGLARGVAKGTIFVLNNPEAAVRIMFEMFPQTKPLGKDEAAAQADGLHPLQALLPVFALNISGVSKWGEASEANYNAYLDFLLKWGVLKQKISASELVTNDLIAEINNFDPAAIAAQARAYK